MSAIHSIHISQEIWNNLLDEFAECINSKRQQSRIITFEDLIKVLWKRDVFVSDRNASSIIKYVSNTAHRDIIQTFIASLNGTKTVNNDPKNVYAQIRQHNVISTASGSQQTPSFQPEVIGSTSTPNSKFEERRRHEIFNVLCDNIDNWRDFGRCLEFTDPELNRCDQELRTDIKLITHRILEQAAEKFGGQFEEKLCIALNNARRKDILRMLKKMNLT